MSKKIWNFIIGLVLIIGGAILLVNPEQSFSKLVFFVGIVLLLTGIIKIIYAFFQIFFMRFINNLNFQHNIHQ